jgi:hypothetical protein
VIEDQVGKTHGSKNYIQFQVTGYNPLTKELHVYIEHIGDPHWHRYIDEGKNYILFRHGNSDDDFSNEDPMELWELSTDQKKWVEGDHIAIPEYDLVLPQILIYYWHKDDRLSMEWDW